MPTAPVDDSGTVLFVDQAENVKVCYFYGIVHTLVPFSGTMRWQYGYCRSDYLSLLGLLVSFDSLRVDVSTQVLCSGTSTARMGLSSSSVH